MILTETMGSSLAVDPEVIARHFEEAADVVGKHLIAEVQERYGLTIERDDVEIHRGQTDDVHAAFVHAVWAPATSRKVEMLGGPRDGEQARMPSREKAPDVIRLTRPHPPLTEVLTSDLDPARMRASDPLLYRRHGINTTTGRWVYIIEKGSA